jgi:hypothetical protein
MRSLLIAVAVLWASPWSLLGLLVGLLGLASGGGVRREGRVLGFYGGIPARLLQHVPIASGAAAMTLGHTVLARTKQDLVATHDHEMVHVRQYERWGPLFVPAYLLCSLAMWTRGGHPYLDNPFERQAYTEAPVRRIT